MAAATSRIALVTGANSGIGFAIAKAMVSSPEPFHVIMAGRSPAKVQSAISEIKAGHNEPDNNIITPLQLDVTDETSIQSAAAAVQKQFGRLDVLVNNAGIAPEGPDVGAMFRTTFATNLLGPVLVSEAFRPLLLASAASSSSSPSYSIYISSVTGSLGAITEEGSPLRVVGAGSAAYRASKTALNMVAMHEQLEAEQRGETKKLKVFAMCPGLVVSNLRGASEGARSAGGRAGDPADSARLVLSILGGERDADARRLINAAGTLPW